MTGLCGARHLVGKEAGERLDVVRLSLVLRRRDAVLRRDYGRDAAAGRAQRREQGRALHALAPSRAAGLLRDAGGQGLGAAARMGSEAAAPRPQDCLFAGACGGRIKVVAVSPGLAGRGAGNEGIMACAARCTSFFAVEAGQGLHSARRERNHVDLQV